MVPHRQMTTGKSTGKWAFWYERHIDTNGNSGTRSRHEERLGKDIRYWTGKKFTSNADEALPFDSEEKAYEYSITDESAKNMCVEE